MRTVAIMQARMTSTRLPGKVMREVLGRPLIDYEIERLSRTSGVDELVVATTGNATDDPIAGFCSSRGIRYFRGSEDDVLDRYYQTALSVGAGPGDTLVRYTADTPLNDPAVSAMIIDAWRSARASGRQIDYMGTDYARLPHGMDTEVFSFEALEIAHAEGSSREDREHVTWYMWHTPQRLAAERCGSREDHSSLRLTVDTPEDFEAVRMIIEALYPKDPTFSLQDIARFLLEHPEIAALNASVKQKHYS